MKPTRKDCSFLRASLIIMARKFAKSFYNSKEWKQCRDAFKASKFGICERCGNANGTEVHHKIELNEMNINDPNITLNFKNLELLCQTCHAIHHNSKYGSTRYDVKFDENGDVVRIQAPPAL